MIRITDQEKLASEYFTLQKSPSLLKDYFHKSCNLGFGFPHHNEVKPGFDLALVITSYIYLGFR